MSAFGGICIISLMATYDDFTKLDIRVGQIVSAEDFSEARKPAYKLTIDFGDKIGIKKSSAQLTQNYTKQDLIGKQILAVVNFPPRQIGPVKSEVLTLGLPSENGDCILATTDSAAPLGSKLY